MTKIAFRNHFDNELKTYENIKVINLVQQCGREKILFEKYTEHIFHYDCKDVTYVAFDFQGYW